MQAISPVTPAQLLAAGQQPLMKLELYDGDYWVNICDGFSFLINACDTTTDWLGIDLSIDTDDKKEGTGSLKDNVAAPVANAWYSSRYNPTGRWNWSAKKHILFWLKSNRASTAFAMVRFNLYEGVNNRWWNLTFSAGEWTAVKLLLSTGGGESGTPPNLALVDQVYVSFRAADTTPFYKKIDYLRIDDVAAGLKGKNYLETISMSLGGAAVTPKPVGGAWNATLSNKDSIFHHKHPTSAYKDWLKTGRKARLSIGATYGGEDRYWQRLIGNMGEPKFTAPDYKVSIGGGDYMKFLQDAQLRIPDNYWGAYQTFDSILSDGLVGDEIYAEGDAMEIGEGEGNNVDDWIASNCLFASIEDSGGGSTYVGRVSNTTADPCYVKKLNVGVGVAGKEYKVKFKHRWTGGDGTKGISLKIYQTAGLIKQIVSYPTDGWTEDIVYFTAIDNTAIQMWFYISLAIDELRFDQFSIREFVPYWERYYQLPEACKGAFYVTLDKGEGAGAEPVWEGTGDEDWEYAEDAEPGPDPPAHPARIVFFNINKEVPKGTDNLIIHYFMTESPENAVARILYFAGLYESEAAALEALEFTPTDITIDRIWFKPGSKLLDAVKKLCERCDYRFHFKWDGTPVFKPKPAPETIAFTFTDQKHISSFSNYQARNEIKNRIIIKGEKQADPASREETMPPELRGEDSDQDSIGLYGERTKTITNHLFQTQGSIDDMCDALLLEYKNPRWYCDLEIPYQCVPLELGDKISWKERLSPVLELTRIGVIRDIKIDGYRTTYKVQVA